MGLCGGTQPPGSPGAPALPSGPAAAAAPVGDAARASRRPTHRPRRVFPPPLLENPGNVPVDVATTEIRNTTVRQLVRVSAAGTRLRLRFSNEDGTDPLTLGAVHVGLAGRRWRGGGRHRPCRHLRTASPQS